jgi:hypothetical protein
LSFSIFASRQSMASRACARCSWMRSPSAPSPAAFKAARSAALIWGASITA